MRFDILFIALSAVFAAANLFCIIFFYQKTAQFITKIFIVPFLTVFYILSANVFLFTVVAAALLCWAGDILLVKRRGAIGISAGVLGGIAAFFCGNICYIISILHFVSFSKSVCLILAAVAFIFVLLFLAFIPVARAEHILKIMAAFYGAALLTLAFCAVILFTIYKDAACAAILAESLCLIVSDLILACSYKNGAGRIANFFVMLFYVAAQFCLLTGLVYKQ
ncbi:MAG: lysoplasmalogenase [Spirochaetaceae bacterium]|jgi:hypothetical protein|nr:lysoplasmalogenase [Spirochaetaceae bacterium]